MYIKGSLFAIDNLQIGLSMKSPSLKTALFVIPSLCLCLPINAAEQQDTENLDVDTNKIMLYRAANTPVNYSFLSLLVGETDYDVYSQNLISYGLGGQVLLNEDYIFKIGYQASLLDQDNSGAEVGYQTNVVNLGIGYRIPIFESTDIELDGQLLYNWDSNDINDTTNDDVGYQFGAYINQSIGNTFEGTFGVNYTSEYGQESIGLNLSATQYITKYAGIGIKGRFASAGSDNFFGDQIYIGAHLRLAFY